MRKLLVLVNGLPGSGKTTLARALAPPLRAQLLSKDTIKEALATCLDNPMTFPTLGGIAMDAVWALAEASNTNVIIDSWWFKPRDLHHAQAGITRAAPTHTIELWCDLPPNIAKARYTNRTRAALHQDTQRLTTDWPLWAEQATPLALTPVISIDTTQPIDHLALADQINLVARVQSDGGSHQ